MQEVLILTEAKEIEKVTITAEATWKKENIVERKTVVYEAHIDPTVIRVAGEKLKKQLFTKYGLFKPRSEEIQFVSQDKYYAPYIVISGRYFIDYFRNRVYVFKVDGAVREVVLLNNTLMPEASKNSRIIKLRGEERLINEVKAFLIMDETGRDAEVDHLPSAPSEKKPEKAIQEFGIEELPIDADINFVRERIAKRPEDISRIVEEVFEVTERTVIYTPRYKLIFKSMRTGEEKALVIDGVSSKRIG
jgi:hypothetical protein